MIYISSLIAELSEMEELVGWIEGTALPGTEEQATLFVRYEKVLSLAAKHGISHIVFHYSQKGFSDTEQDMYQSGLFIKVGRALRRHLIAGELSGSSVGPPFFFIADWNLTN